MKALNDVEYHMNKWKKDGKVLYKTLYYKYFKVTDSSKDNNNKFVLGLIYKMLPFTKKVSRCGKSKWIPFYCSSFHHVDNKSYALQRMNLNGTYLNYKVVIARKDLPFF